MDFRNRHIDIVGKQNLWFSISAILIIVGMVSWAVWGLNQGVDFRGGGQLSYLIPAAQRPHNGDDVVVLDKARKALEGAGLKGLRLQITGGDTLLVSTDADTTQGLDQQEKLINTALASQLSETNKDGSVTPPKLLSRDMVGPVVGKELRANAVKGVILGLLFIAAWVFYRYNFSGNGYRYAIGGTLALVHDLLIMVGAFALIGHFYPSVEIDSSYIAALLTVVGYSINDNVVIFDRIRENMRERRHDPFKKIVNDSLLETMSRSVNTIVTVEIMLIVMFFFGGDSIHNFILAMIIGVTTGMYSSIFIASMIVTAWHNWDERKLARANASREATRKISSPTNPQPSAIGSPSETAPSHSNGKLPNRPRNRKRF